jgi:hypothetical protein
MAGQKRPVCHVFLKIYVQFTWLVIMSGISSPQHHVLSPAIPEI